jgi:O-antigen biosynthesis protein
MRSTDDQRDEPDPAPRDRPAVAPVPAPGHDAGHARPVIRSAGSTTPPEIPAARTPILPDRIGHRERRQMSTAPDPAAAPSGGERSSAPGGRTLSTGSTWPAAVDPGPVPAGPPARPPAVDADFAPIQIGTVELAEPLPTVRRGVSTSGVPYGCARVLVLLHDVPLGVVWLDLDAGEVAPAAVAAAVRESLGERVLAHLDADRAGVTADTLASTLVAGVGASCRVTGPDPVPRASVVLATRGRPDSLPVTIDSLLRSDHPDFEVVVVDNSPSDPRTAQLIAERYADDPRLRLVAEPRPGLSYARNRGLAAVQGDVVAFTDDDVTVSSSWLRQISAEFADPAVTCVTGLVEPVELESLWQWWFECAAGFGRGFDRRVYQLAAAPDDSPLFPYQMGIYGTGASMALRRSALPRGWAFDEALGAGSPAAGGEDLDLFLDVLTLGGTLVYQPAALVYHRHRADGTGLHAQMRGYGRGLTALIAKRMLLRPRERALLLRRVAAGVRHALSPEFRAGAKDDVPAAPYPRALRIQETFGMLQGPAMYLTGARRVRKGRKEQP